MPRFFFHLYDHDGLVEDPEGLELAGLAEVRAVALKGARSVISQDAQEGRIDLTRWIDVVDQDGEPVLTLSFRDAVKLDA